MAKARPIHMPRPRWLDDLRPMSPRALRAERERMFTTAKMQAQFARLDEDLENLRQGRITFERWPYSDKHLDVMIKASFTAAGFRGYNTLVRETGIVYNYRKNEKIFLERAGLLTGCVPTELGWRMLWRYARREACFPGEIEAELRRSNGERSHGQSCSVQERVQCSDGRVGQKA